MTVIQEKVSRQNVFFDSQQTKDINYRIRHLKRLRDEIQRSQQAILEALALDLGKANFEAYSSEVGYLLESIHHFIKNLKKWAKPIRKVSPLFMPISKSRIYYEPLGVVLIIGPFNYPLQLVLEPLIGAIAAGNTCLLKPSEKTPYTNQILQTIISEVFAPEYVDVIFGGEEVVTELIHSKVHHIFFTGSEKVGRVVMEAASKQLIPVTLELGGKSPTIVHADADIKKAAARIAWGKFYNTGQTCIAPDYVYVHQSIKNEFLEALKATILSFYGEKPLTSPDFGRIIDEESFNRLVGLIDEKKLFYGGEYDRERLKIAPTVLTEVDWTDAVMQEEIFGPILPALTYASLDETLSVIKEKPSPLAFYLFSESRKIQQEGIQCMPFGGGCINDTISQVTSPRLPFGGVRNSGMGSYHGKESFMTFSNKKSIMKKSTLFDIKIMYPPYKGKLSLLKKIMK